jgi:hypothetical protein
LAAGALTRISASTTAIRETDFSFQIPTGIAERHLSAPQRSFAGPMVDELVQWMAQDASQKS